MTLATGLANLNERSKTGIDESGRIKKKWRVFRIDQQENNSLWPDSLYLKNTQEYLIDFPDFDPKQKLIFQVFQSLILKQILQTAREVKLLLVVPYNEGRPSPSTDEFMRILNKSFKGDFLTKNSKSCLLITTNIQQFDHIASGEVLIRQKESRGKPLELGDLAQFPIYFKYDEEREEG